MTNHTEYTDPVEPDLAEIASDIWHAGQAQAATEWVAAALFKCTGQTTHVPEPFTYPAPCGRYECTLTLDLSGTTCSSLASTVFDTPEFLFELGVHLARM